MASFGLGGPNLQIAVACSGGPDSLCLTHLAQDWARRRGGCVIALHVDHRLRTESTAEARTLRSDLAEAGIPCRILSWAHDPIGSGVQARARRVRYAALIDSARRAGCLALLTGHTADDDDETRLMRAERRPEAAAIPGIPLRRVEAEVQILRPLLSTRRAEVEAWLASRGLTPLQDPSNRDRRYERVRARQDGGIAPPAAAASDGEDLSILAAAVTTDPGTGNPLPLLCFSWDPALSQPVLTPVLRAVTAALSDQPGRGVTGDGADQLSRRLRQLSPGDATTGGGVYWTLARGRLWAMPEQRAWATGMLGDHPIALSRTRRWGCWTLENRGSDAVHPKLWRGEGVAPAVLARLPGAVRLFLWADAVPDTEAIRGPSGLTGRFLASQALHAAAFPVVPLSSNLM